MKFKGGGDGQWFSYEETVDCGHNHLRNVFIILKGSSDPSHFVFESNLGKSRIRHKSTLKWNNEFLDRPRND